MNRHNFFVKFLNKINSFINSLLRRNLNKLNSNNLKKLLINNKIFLSIVVTISPLIDMFTSLDKLMRLLKPFNIKLKCVHVGQPHGDGWDMARLEGMKDVLHEKYKDQGLVVLGFPCNQFLGQEPLSDEEMESTCEINHGVTFQLTKKIDVNGKNTDPVFNYLKKKKGGFLFSSIKWNFTKFLVDKKGVPMKRYAPNVKPLDIEQDIKSLLA